MTGIYRPPPPKSSSKASASTLCQKCLKRDNYECKSEAQARPYVARPSRTQQLFNPKLAPKLTNDAPNDLMRKKGVADEQLALLAAERRQNRSRTRNVDDTNQDGRRERSRSVLSDASSFSVSTVSTNRSRTHSSPRRDTHPQSDSYMTSQSQQSSYPHETRERNSTGKRRRSPSLKPESTSDDDDARNTRRRRNIRSPEQRGRGRDKRSRSHERETRSQSHSDSRADRRHREQAGRSERHDRQPRSRSPYAKSQGPTGRRDGGHARRFDRESSPRRRPAPARERSLSPFSKRLALTQAMGKS